MSRATAEDTDTLQMAPGGGGVVRKIIQERDERPWAEPGHPFS